jgi:hypothetical protein
MTAVMTTNGHVKRALSFYNESSIYVGIGRTAAWANELVPPAPTGAETGLDTPIGYKKIYDKQMVKPDAAGTIRYRGQNWSTVTTANAYSQGAKWVMVTAYLEYDELPVDIQYRQVGVFTGLTPNTGVTKSNLLPSEVSSVGQMEVLDNRKPEIRDIDKKEGIVVIVEF